ncbi:dynein regulatory complex subunit 5 [Xyrichtys novacula]|uniref:Dynein regulatory complex subunit 5 n=1 Tax=Xyrichtys novacula TaxID=13765 RepID=A0AAV1GYF3_XYRNO|nr:dynein regulatory complex subunit 5 [Xyrichtys novacula]
MSRSPYLQGATINPAEDFRRMRRIVAEDLDWTLVIVPCLSKLCLQSFIRNFEEKPIFEELSPTQRDFVQEGLSTSLPLNLTANLISDGVFWKRCCEERWDLCDVSHYGHSWKRMFFERHMENIIELFIPYSTEEKTVLEMVPLCKNYVKRLNISQLLPPIREPEGEEEDELGLDSPYQNENEGQSMDHFNFKILLSKLTNLEELHLVYKVNQCGMNFEWQMFEMTDKDCKSLASALKSCKTLKILRLHESHIEDKKCLLLVKHLLDHPSLRELDFSHNLIGDKGARAVAKLLNKSQLETLNLYDNDIRDHGAKALAHALAKNPTLQSLNLRLNRVGDEGGQAIANALLNNKTLSHLHLGANKVTEPTVITLAKVIAQNNTLKSINISCNCLGEDGGKALEEAMSYNTSITECDVCLTGMGEQSVSFINQAVWTNKKNAI